MSCSFTFCRAFMCIQIDRAMLTVWWWPSAWDVDFHCTGCCWFSLCVGPVELMVAR